MKNLSWVLAAAIFGLPSTAYAQLYEVDWEFFDCPGFEEAKFEQYLYFEDFCFRIEVTCPEGVGGHLDATLVSDGGIGIGVGVGDPSGGCGFSGGHYINSKFTHTCEFESGAEFELEVKAVGVNHCSKEE